MREGLEKARNQEVTEAFYFGGQFIPVGAKITFKETANFGWLLVTMPDGSKWTAKE